MRRAFTSWAARLGVLAAAGALVAGFAPDAFAQGGQSTPGVTVTATNPGVTNPGTPPGASTMKLTLTAHTEKSTVTSPSCRPEDMTLDCQGSLVLRIPAFGGFSVTGFQVHRVAVGAITCGGDEGDCGDGEGMTATLPAAVTAGEAVQAQVNGLATVVDPGDSNLAPGDVVQLKITLTDNGPAQYRDGADVLINQFTSGSNKPYVYDTGPQLIQQVAIHWLGGEA